MLNLGCGEQYLPNWTNIDFVSNSPDVIQANLLEGIPCGDEVFDFVYCSHVLEHFSYKDGYQFLLECKRVLRPGGILRIVVPNLETIVHNYIICLNKLREKPNELDWANYNWTYLEMFDQIARNKTGGEMAAYLKNISKYPNQDFVKDRIGDDFFCIPSPNHQDLPKPTWISRIIRKRDFRMIFLRIFLSHKELEYLRIGRFRLQGENHYHMYDEVSLKDLLKKTGFTDSQVFSASTSFLPSWDGQHLDIKNGKTRKPDSLFLESIK